MRRWLDVRHSSQVAVPKYWPRAQAIAPEWGQLANGFPGMARR